MSWSNCCCAQVISATVAYCLSVVVVRRRWDGLASWSGRVSGRGARAEYLFWSGNESLWQ